MRLKVWAEVSRHISGVAAADRAALRKALSIAPVDVFRSLDRWRDPVVATDCWVVARGIGKFRIRARSDDLYHALPTREPAVIGAIRQLLRPGDCFVDAGANIGIYSVLASQLVGPGGRVIAIEMMPETAVILDNHLTENGCENARLVVAALSDSPNHKITAHVTEGKFGQASIATGKGDRTFEVETTTLAEVLADVTRVALIKMDLEGAELKALKGGEPVLDRVDAILFEDWGGDTIGAFLTERGFKIIRLDGRNSLASRL